MPANESLRQQTEALIAEALEHHKNEVRTFAGGNHYFCKRCSTLAPCVAIRLASALTEAQADTERIEWAEQHPDAAMRAIQYQWDLCGPGWREEFFGFRAAMDEARAQEGKP